MASRGSFGDYGDDYRESSHNAAISASHTGNELTRLTQVIGNNIQKISRNVSRMNHIVNEMGTPQDTPDLRDKLHDLQQQTNQMARDTSGYLKDLSQLPNPPSHTEKKQRHLQKTRLADEFGTVLKSFQDFQRSAAAKEKESIARTTAFSGAGFNETFPGDVGHDLGTGFGSQLQGQTTLQMEQDIDLKLLKEREESIKKLEGDIIDVNQIFTDLGMLVHEQGESVDSIEKHVEDAAMHVEEGGEQLRQARISQSKARTKKCILLIIVLVVLGVVALILGITLS